MEAEDRVEQAKEVIASCRTERGFRASTDQYPELWLRDLVFSEDVLLKLGYAQNIGTHLEALLAEQKGNGQIPNLITTPARRLLSRSFHSWTSDSEVLLLIGTRKYVNFAGDLGFLKKHEGRLERCLRFVERKLDASGFIPGCDWRDAMMNYEDKTLLANQVHLLEMYELLGHSEESRLLRGRIRAAYYSEEEGFFADFIWNDGGSIRKGFCFDSLGNALAVKHGLLLPSETKGMVSAFNRNKTRYGYRNLFPPYQIRRLDALTSTRTMNAFLRTGAVLRTRRDNYQNSGIWPFVEARVLRAFLKLGLPGEARALFGTMLSRKGFNEWYSPLNGEPRGSRQQLWTAAALIDASDALTAGT